MAANSSTYSTNHIRSKSLAWTLGIHALLLMLFFFWKYQVPVIAPVEDLGMEVNLGTSADGTGDDQPMNTDDPAAVASLASATPVAPSESQEKSYMESDDPDASAIAKPTTTTQKPTPVINKENQRKTTNTNRSINNTSATTPHQTPRYVYNGATGAGGNGSVSNRDGSSEGNTTGTGDRGVPNGTPGAANYIGTPGAGTGGFSHTLSGRDISPKTFEAEFNESGTVVLRIKVDRNGVITLINVVRTTSSALTKKAVQLIGKAKFNANQNAAPEQFGEITIKFKTRS